MEGEGATRTEGEAPSLNLTQTEVYMQRKP